MKLSPSSQMMFNVLHITMLNNDHKEIGTATGFLFGFCKKDDGSNLLCLVSNRHVLGACPHIRISVTCAGKDGSPDIGNLIQIETSTRYVLCHPNPEIDLAIIPMANVWDAICDAGKKMYYVMSSVDDIPTEKEWNEFNAMEHVVMPGFPKGLRDEVNNQPIIRSGVTATHPALDFRGTPKFLVDLPCYEGCSGSPVFLYNEGLRLNRNGSDYTFNAGDEIKLLGIQHAIPAQYSIGKLATVPAAGTKDVPVTQLYLNLGFIIKSTELLAFEEILKTQVVPVLNSMD